jgi:putative oxidoreductase
MATETTYEHGVHPLGLPFVQPLAAYAPTVLRIAVGLVAAAHGWSKFNNGVDGVAGFFGSLGIPAPQLMAMVVITVELLGGLMIVLGLLTRVWALLFATVVLVAILTAKSSVPLLSMAGADGHAELEFTLLAGSLAIALLGPGRLALDRMLGIEPGANV